MKQISFERWAGVSEWGWTEGHHQLKRDKVKEIVDHPNLVVTIERTEKYIQLPTDHDNEFYSVWQTIDTIIGVSPVGCVTYCVAGGLREDRNEGEMYERLLNGDIRYLNVPDDWNDKRKSTVGRFTSST